MPLEITPKSVWSGRPPNKLLKRIAAPVTYVFFCYTNKNYNLPKAKSSPGSRPSSSQCVEELNYLLKGDFKRIWDIRYNFLIGPGGALYEGRGWFKQPYLPVKFKELEPMSLFVAYLGDYSDESPSPEMFQTREEFMIFGVRNQFICRECTEITLTQ